MVREGIKILENPAQHYFDQFHERAAETENWRYRPDEYTIWQKSYSNFSFYLAIDGKTDKVISGAAVAQQITIDDHQPCFIIGNYYCVPEWRGKGISNELFKIVMNKVGQDNCALLAAPKMSPLYASRFNFSLIHDYWINAATILSEHIKISHQFFEHHEFSEIIDSDWNDIYNFDEKISQLNRHEYIRHSLSDNSTISRICRDTSGKLLAFGAIKNVSGDEIYLSPVYADDDSSAKSLISCLLETAKKLWTFSKIVVLYPEPNKNMSDFLNEISDDRVKTHNEYRTQFTRRSLDFPLDKVWACEDSSHGLI